MKFQHELSIPDWQRAKDDPMALIGCIPGIQHVEEGQDGTYTVQAVNGIGPVRLKLNGTAKVTEPDTSSLIADVTLHEPIAGTIYGTFTLRTISDQNVALEAELTLGGRLGEFAQPLLRKKAQDTVKGFQKNLLALLAKNG